MDVMKTARRRYFHQSESAREHGEFTRRQVKASGAWDSDWNAPSKSVKAQIGFANHLNETLPPEAMAVLNTPKPLRLDQFRHQLKRWRIESGNLHHNDCPSRRLRKIEYIAALEFGFNPRKAATGRIHAHVLLYNLHSIRLDDLRQLWREMNQIKNPEEPLIQPYTPGPEGILYSLKSYGSDVDLIEISPKLSRQSDDVFCLEKA
jgi:hypothetical protein